MKKRLMIALAALSCATLAQAADILRLPGSTTLSDVNYWDGGVAPGSADVALFDGTTVPDTNSVAYGTASFWPGGWKFTDIQGPVSFEGNAYVYGFGVVVESSAAADVTFNALRVGNTPGFGPLTVAPERTVTIGWISTSSGKTAGNIPISGGGTVLVNGSATATSARMMFNVFGSGTTIGGNGTWAPYWANSGYGMQIGTGCYIAPGNNGIGTMTIDSAIDGQTALIMADGSGFKFELGVGGSYALPGGSDMLSLVSMTTNDVVFQGTTTIDFQGTGSAGVFKLIDTDAGTNTWSGLTLSGQEIVGGLAVANLASGLPASSLLLGDGTTGDAGDIYLVVGEPPAPYIPTSVFWAAGTGDWDIDATANWDNGSGPAVYYEEGGIGDAVAFDDMATGPWPIFIALNTNVYPSAMAVDATGDYTITGTGSINGSTALTKAGSGTLTIGLANTYSGGTTINDGMIELSTVGATLGSSAVTIANDAQLTLYRGNTSDDTTASAFANPLIVPAGATGTVWNMPRGTWSGLLTGSGTLNLRVNATRCEFSDDWSEFSGQINVTSRSGNDEFRIQRSYTSGLRLGSAKLNLADGVYMHQTATPQSGDTGTVHEIGELSGTSGAIIGGSSVGGRYANWTVGALNTDSTFAGTIRNDINQDNWGGYGAAKLTKVGTGTLTLSGTNTYTGATAVNGGTLYLSGAIAATSNVVIVTVATNAAIGGSGTIGGDLVMNDGALFAFNPGDTLTVSNSLVFNNTEDTFGVDDLVVGDWGSVSDGTYTLINGFTNTLTGVDGSSYDIGGGRAAHLQASGSLQVVVGTGSAPATIIFSVGGGSAYLSWDTGGTYNVLTNSSLTNPGGWGVAVPGAQSPVSIPIGSESQLFYRLN